MGAEKKRLKHGQGGFMSALSLNNALFSNVRRQIAAVAALLALPAGSALASEITDVTDIACLGNNGVAIFSTEMSGEVHARMGVVQTTFKISKVSFDEEKAQTKIRITRPIGEVTYQGYDIVLSGQAIAGEETTLFGFIDNASVVMSPIGPVPVIGWLTGVSCKLKGI
jgi:hypothetical protein